MFKKMLASIAVVIVVLTLNVMKANATLYTDAFGSMVPGYAQNDDSYFGSFNLGFSINFFGNTYSQLYINNNGNVTFGSGTGAFSPLPLNSQSTMPMIAPFWTDLDTRGGTVDAGIYLNQTANKTIVTWNKMGYYSQNQTGTSTFQLVLNNANALPTGEGNIGFFYGNMQSGTDGHQATVGFGDGLAAINPGEISYLSGSTASLTQALNGTNVWFNVDSTGTPIAPDPIATPTPIPAAAWLLGSGLVGLVGLRRRNSQI